MNQTLLVELLTEELPPKALVKLGDAFAAAIVNGLKARDFLDEGSAATTYATPRRLAVSITKVRGTSPDKSIRDKVLPVSVALDADGNPTAPLAKKLAAMGFADVTVDRLERAADGKAESFFYTHTAQGSLLSTGLQATLTEALGKLPIPKLMSYQRPDGDTVQFVRPAHKLVALHGEQVLPLTALGLTASNITLGHRFLTDGSDIAIAHAQHYAATLETEGKVIASPAARKDRIRTALLEKAGADKVLMPESLLDEVAALVEWPVVYECRFEDEFLAVPQECLILTMQTNQKYFALTDRHGKLRSRFLIVSNLETADPQHIIGGNERVVRPRLADAKFFFEQDKKKTLEARLPLLMEVNGNKLAFMGCNGKAAYTFVKATATSPGAADCDYDFFTKQISALKAQGYMVIFTFQHEECYYPGPCYKHEEGFRAVADAGATVVSGSQAHYPHLMEFRGDAFIHYGLGNLFFDQMTYELPDGSVIDGTRREFIDRHVFYDGKYLGVELLTAMLEDFSRPRPMNERERTQFLSDYFYFSGWIPQLPTPVPQPTVTLTPIVLPTP